MEHDVSQSSLIDRIRGRSRAAQHARRAFIPLIVFVRKRLGEPLVERTGLDQLDPAWVPVSLASRFRRGRGLR